MSTKKTGMKEFIKFFWRNGKVFRAYPLRDKAKIQLTLANLKIALLDNKSKLYQQRVAEFNDGMIFWYQGRWLATEAIRTKDNNTWKKAFACFKSAIKIADQLNTRLEAGDEKDIRYQRPGLERRSEIVFSEGVPLVPDITPIVILQGSSYQMGYQYAEQLVTIYGEWILERHTHTVFTDEQLADLKKWEDIHRSHTPEIIDFVQGWVAFSIQKGIVLSYEQVLNLWVGHQPPASSYLNAEAGMPELPPLACTALAAWNTATEDGKLIAASTGDHMLTYQITIVMYPDEGIPLVYTPFEATGALPGLGSCWFFGHPGLNLAGLAYVHHGGGPKLLEPRAEWGYGLRRGASVLHNLRFKSTAREALEQELSWPIGDIGYGDQATVGGFYADSDYGYIIESRKEPLCIREPGLLDEQDYLFANNSAIHPAAIQSEWMRKIKDLWIWDTTGGWRPKKPQGMTKSLALTFQWFTGQVKIDELMSRGMMFAYWNSYNRNKFLNTMAKKLHGKISVAEMKKVYRTTGTMPQGEFKKLKRAYLDRGEWGQISAAHSSNALVAIMKPSEGLYSLCTGPAIRGAAPISPDFAISIYNERNAFWDIVLTREPIETVKKAQQLANDLVRRAELLYNSNKVENKPLEVYQELLAVRKQSQSMKVNNLFNMNKAIRIYTRIQVIARQFIHFYELPEFYKDLSE